MNAIKLTELNPKWVNWRGKERGGIGFQCPLHRDGDCKDNAMIGNRIVIPFKEAEQNGWDKTGDSFDNITLSPSIMPMNENGTPHWHGWIRKGMVEW